MIVLLQIIFWFVVKRIVEIAESRESWNSHKLLVCGAQNGDVVVLVERPKWRSIDLFIMSFRESRLYFIGGLVT